MIGAGYKHFFHHIDESMKAMCQLLSQGRAPSELPHVLAARFADIGRNDPCPCGSGAKFKKCHGAALDTAESDA